MFSGNITIWWATKFILWSGDLTFLPSWSRTFGHFGPRPNDHYIIGLILRNFGVRNFMVYLYTDTWAFGLSPFDMSPEIYLELYQKSYLKKLSTTVPPSAAMFGPHIGKFENLTISECFSLAWFLVPIGFPTPDYNSYPLCDNISDISNNIKPSKSAQFFATWL